MTDRYPPGSGFSWPVALLVLLFALPARLPACPFCTALGPSIAQRREAADVVLLAEVFETPANAAAGGSPTRFKIHRKLSGALDGMGREMTAKVDVALAQGDLALLFGEFGDEGQRWTAVRVNETSLGYVIGSPDMRQSVAARLRYFSRFLEHSDPLIAADAYLEFGHAPFDEVKSLGEAVPFARLRRWLVDPKVLPAHQGLYGLLAGLPESAAAKQQSAAFLREQIEAPAVDFRAGFDGLLGGYLLAAGEPGLDWLDRRYLENPEAAVGDLRHLHTALRFYREFGKEIDPKRLTRSLRRLLDRPPTAAAAIVDLARWQDWESAPRIAGLFGEAAYRDGPTRRAIVGFLAADPQPQAAQLLAGLRKQDASGVAEAEAELEALGGKTE